jgi:putative two-component system response regulator
MHVSVQGSVPTVGAPILRPRALAAHKIAPAAAIVAMVLAIMLLIRSTGGLPNVFVNAFYAVIALAAYHYGWRGALATTLTIASIVPIAVAAGLKTDGFEPWLVRLASFSLIGGMIGLLFERMSIGTRDLHETIDRVRQRERDGMIALARGAEAKDTDFGDHIRRVQLTAEALAEAAGVGRDDAGRIGWAAMLHDVGKLHVPNRILLKPGKLTPAEWDVMRRHTIWGERILADGDGFAMARRIARWHHENFDGTGYPDNLAAGDIPLEARIVRIADSFDAMTNDRPYSRARSFEEALEELHRYAGVQFDPELVELMVALIRKEPALTSRLNRLSAPTADRFIA